MRATTEFRLKKWHHSQLAREQIHTRMLFSRALTASNFNLVLKVAGRAVLPMSVLNDCWMIYQVASGSSVGHRTRAECKRESGRFKEDRSCSHLGCLERRPMVWQGTMGCCRCRLTTAWQGRVTRLPSTRMPTPPRQADLLFYFLTVWVNNISRFSQHNLEAMLFKYLHMKLHSKMLPAIFYKVFKQLCLHSTTHTQQITLLILPLSYESKQYRIVATSLTSSIAVHLTLLAAVHATIFKVKSNESNSNILEVAWCIIRQHIYPYHFCVNVLAHHGDKLYAQSVLYPVRVFTELQNPEGLSCGSPH